MYELDRFFGNLENVFDNKINSPKIKETEKAYLLILDLPGVAKDDIDLKIDHGVLSIKAERKDEFENGKKYQSYRQSFTLPSNINEEEVEANQEEGVLKIVIPKATKSNKKSIPIGDHSKKWLDFF